MKTAILFALASLFLMSCASLSSFTSEITKPSLKVTGTKLQDLSLDKVNLLMDLEVGNPYSVPLPLTNLEYALTSEGEKFLDGKADVQGTIPAKESKTIQIPIAVAFAPLMKVLGNVKPGATIPYAADMNLSVDAPAVGPMTLPIRKEGELPIPAVPEVEVSNIQWQELSWDKASAKMALKVTNPNSFPIELSKFNYNLKLGDTSVAQDTIQQSTKFAEQGSNTLDVPLSISPMQLGFGAFQLLQGKGSKYSLDGGLEVSSPFGPISLPFNRTGETTFTK